MVARFALGFAFGLAFVAGLRVLRVLRDGIYEALSLSLPCRHQLRNCIHMSRLQHSLLVHGQKNAIGNGGAFIVLLCFAYVNFAYVVQKNQSKD